MPGRDPSYTPEPYFLPGYTGYCPQLPYQLGETYGKATHKVMTTKPEVSGRLSPTGWEEHQRKQEKGDQTLHKKMKERDARQRKEMNPEQKMFPASRGKVMVPAFDDMPPPKAMADYIVPGYTGHIYDADRYNHPMFQKSGGRKYSQEDLDDQASTISDYYSQDQRAMSGASYRSRYSESNASSLRSASALCSPRSPRLKQCCRDAIARYNAKNQRSPDRIYRNFISTEATPTDDYEPPRSMCGKECLEKYPECQRAAYLPRRVQSEQMQEFSPRREPIMAHNAGTQTPHRIRQPKNKMFFNEEGRIPMYTGYVPGMPFTLGETYGRSSRRLLNKHRDQMKGRGQLN